MSQPMVTIGNGVPLFNPLVGPGLENMRYTLRMDIRCQEMSDCTDYERAFLSMFIEDELIAPEILYPVNQFTTSDTINVSHEYFFKTNDGKLYFLDGVIGDRYRYLKFFKKEGKSLLEAVKTIQHVEQL